MPQDRKWTHEWLRNQIDRYKNEQEAYRIYTRMLKKILRRACSLLTTGGQVQCRAKTLASYAEKAIRKYSDKRTNPVNEFTDLCGGRTITYTQAEADRICQFVRANFTIDERNSEDVRERLGPDQFGYRAIHFVVQMPWVGLLGHGPFKQTLDDMSRDLNRDFSEDLKKTGDPLADTVFRQIVMESVCRQGEPDLDIFLELAQVMPKAGAAMLGEVIEEILAEEPDYSKPIEVICRIGNRKAEIQASTVLQNAWTAISHDRLYKSDFKVPPKLERQLHRVSALLEESDEEFARAIEKVDEYKLDYGAYMTPATIEQEIRKWEAVAKHEPLDMELARKIAGLAIATEDWRRVKEALDPFRECGNPDVLRDLGLALSKMELGGGWELNEAVRLNPRDAVAWIYLGDSHCHLSDTYERRSSAEAVECQDALAKYAAAFRADLSNPDAFSRYLECHICQTKNVEAIALLRPTVQAAREKCYQRAAVHVHMPWALYHLGFFDLLLGEPYQSLGAYAKAVYLSDSEKPIEAAIRSLEKLKVGLRDSVPEWAPHLDCVLRFLRLAKVAKLQQLHRIAPALEKRKREELSAKEKELEVRQSDLETARELLLKERQMTSEAVSEATFNQGQQARLRVAGAKSALQEARDAVESARSAWETAKSNLVEAEVKAELAHQEFLRFRLHTAYADGGRMGIREPVVIVVGSCDPRFEQHVLTYRERLLEGFRGFRGTISCGGTRAGISGIIGAVQEKYSDLDTIGYLPNLRAEAVPEWVCEDERYRHRICTGGEDFTALEPLQSWIDIVAAGIKPYDVRVLGVDGGEISAFEYRMALALDACVGVLEKGGREAARLLPDEDWGKSERLMVLPAEKEIIREYLLAGSFALPSEIRQPPTEVARRIHNAYLEIRKQDLISDDPATKPWEQLAEELKESNLRQLEHVSETLAGIGCYLHPVEGDPILLDFTPHEIERMAAIEHARFVIERFLKGWRWGPEKDLTRRLNPTLVGWAELPDSVKDYDRKAVAEIPKYVAEAGLEVRRKKPQVSAEPKLKLPVGDG